MKFKPTREQCRIIRECAEKDAGYAKVEICPSTKYHLTDHSKPHAMNILAVTNEPLEKAFDTRGGWDDTDLHDNAFAWKDFTRGVELTENGDGIFDFYVYGPLGYNKELQTNVTAYFRNKKLVRVDGVPNTRWTGEV